MMIPGLPEEIVQILSESSGVAVDGSRSRTFRAGHAGTAMALVAALDELNKGAPAVIVGAVDSYHHPEVLAWLDAECRLHALDAENGFVPGEGAGFLLLTPRLAKNTKGKDALARETREARAAREAREAREAPVLLRRVEVGVEETVLNDEANVGKAMTGILRGSGPLGARREARVVAHRRERRAPPRARMGPRRRSRRLRGGRGASAACGQARRSRGRFRGRLCGAGHRAGEGRAAARDRCVWACGPTAPSRGAFLMSFEGAAR